VISQWNKHKDVLRSTRGSRLGALREQHHQASSRVDCYREQVRHEANVRPFRVRAAVDLPLHQVRATRNSIMKHRILYPVKWSRPTFHSSKCQTLSYHRRRARKRLPSFAATFVKRLSSKTTAHIRLPAHVAVSFAQTATFHKQACVGCVQSTTYLC